MTAFAPAWMGDGTVRTKERPGWCSHVPAAVLCFRAVRSCPIHSLHQHSARHVARTIPSWHDVQVSRRYVTFTAKL